VKQPVMRLGRKPSLIFVQMILAIAASLVAIPHAGADVGLGADQLVELAIEVNPQVRAARARWDSAEHQILQHYAPADPTFDYLNVDSRRGLGNAGTHSHQFNQAFQFPGKALLQADQAKRTARIARLAYDATIRDIRAAVETAYYQLLLDDSLMAVNLENIGALKQVLQVTQVAYSGSQVTQTDFISAEFDLSQAELQQRQYETSKTNDEVMLNQLLHRPPGAPLHLDRRMQLQPVRLPLNTLVDMATRVRQEILQTALTERNANTALELAKMEYLPDFNVGYTFDYYLIQSFAPSPQGTQTHTVSVGFNLPIFFWIKQREDVKAAGFDLEAARADLSSIRSQTEASVTQLYRTAQLAYETSQLYRNSLIPLARQDFQVALVSYQSNKLAFVALSGALQRSYVARTSYLQATNQFIAGRVALEQAIGAPLPQ
jgi:outer membrane protein TolC